MSSDAEMKNKRYTLNFNFQFDRNLMFICSIFTVSNTFQFENKPFHQLQSRKFRKLQSYLVKNTKNKIFSVPKIFDSATSFDCEQNHRLNLCL